MIHLSELGDACIPPGQPARAIALNKRLNLHIINDNGIETRMTRKCLLVSVLSYQRVIYLCLLILTNAPGILAAQVSPSLAPAVTVCHPWSPMGQKSAACLQCHSPHCTPGVQLYTHAYGQS